MDLQTYVQYTGNILVTVTTDFLGQLGLTENDAVLDLIPWKIYASSDCDVVQLNINLIMKKNIGSERTIVV